MVGMLRVSGTAIVVGEEGDSYLLLGDFYRRKNIVREYRLLLRRGSFLGRLPPSHLLLANCICVAKCMTNLNWKKVLSL